MSDVQTMKNLITKLQDAVDTGRVQTKDKKVKKHTPGHLFEVDNILAMRRDGNFGKAEFEFTATSLKVICYDRHTPPRVLSSTEFFVFDDEYPSYSLSGFSPAEHIELIIDAADIWVAQLQLSYRLPAIGLPTSMAAYVKDYLSELSAQRTYLRKGAYSEAYLVNLAPPHSFSVGVDRKVHIAQAYVLAKGTDGIWNVFFEGSKCFGSVMNRSSNMTSLIETFNLNGTGVTIDNFLQIMRNTSGLGTEFFMECEGTKRRVFMDRIDGPCQSELVEHFPWE